jgi:hypothetical protein
MGYIGFSSPPERFRGGFLDGMQAFEYFIGR